jgi:hypothetical protein
MDTMEEVAGIGVAGRGYVSRLVHMGYAPEAAEHIAAELVIDLQRLVIVGAYL